MDKEEMRRMPLENKFYQNKINDIVFGYLQTISYLDKNDVRFVYRDTVNFSELERKFGVDEKGKPVLSRLKIMRAIKVLIAYGFVEEGTVEDLYGKTVKAYILPYNKNNPYQLIPNNTLKFLVDTANSNVIKIYVFLLNKYLWKKETKEQYVFSNKELIKKIGKKSTTHQRDYNMINNILTSLENNGLIKYVQYYEKYKDIVTPKKKLVHASLHYKEHHNE